MPTRRRMVLLLAGCVAILMLLFPPWETFGGHYLGHSVITSPPASGDSGPDTQRWALPPAEPIGRISFSLLAVQYAALWICAGVAYLLLAPPRRQ